MEKETYYELSDNADMSITVPTLRECMDLIECDYLDIVPNDRENVYYTIKPVLMTDDEYYKLCEETV